MCGHFKVHFLASVNSDWSNKYMLNKPRIVMIFIQEKYFKK